MALTSSKYKTDSYVIVKFINQRHLDLTPDLLKSLEMRFKSWEKDFERQKKEDLPKYKDDERGKALKRTWKDSKKFEINNLLHDLEQNIVILQNNFYIKQLYERIASLENDLNQIKIDVQKLSSGSLLSMCGSSVGLISTTSSIIPVVGDIVSYISGLISASCFLANEFN